MIWAKLANILPRGVREKLFWIGVKRGLRKAGVKEGDVDKITGLIKGWKSKGAGLAAILGGGAVIARTFAGEFDFNEMIKGWSMITAGLGFMGWAGKKEKETAAVLLSSPNAAVVAETKTALAASGTKVP